MIFSEGRGVCNLCHGRKHTVWVTIPPEKLDVAAASAIVDKSTHYGVESAFRKAAAFKMIYSAGFLITVEHCNSGQVSGALVEEVPNG